jgi:Cytochrome C oxidase, cbb3-type, subunit III
MKRPHLLSWLGTAVMAGACASAGQPQSGAGATRTIEPGSGGGLGSGSGRSSEAVAGNGAEEESFVISRKPPTSNQPVEELPPIHLADDWWRFRAEFLRTSIPQVRERDAGFSDGQPPPVFWDQQTAIEAASVWGALCNECHGGRRRVEDAVKMPPPPAGWGKGSGLFFGVRRPYESLFNTIYNGGPERNGKRSEMPAWRGRLAREQIWAILYFLEYQSGGIEGRFPPSLYPRQARTD